MNLIQISKIYEKDNNLIDYSTSFIKLFTTLRSLPLGNGNLNLYTRSENYRSFLDKLIYKKYNVSILYNKSITKDLSKFDFEVYYKHDINTILEYDDLEYHDYYINDTTRPDFSLHGLYDVLVGEIGTVIITRK